LLDGWWEGCKDGVLLGLMEGCIDG
jgi:hypothetical protein